MPGNNNGDPGSQNPQQDLNADSGSFSFQQNSNQGGSSATPTAPFETISYQSATPVNPQEVKPDVVKSASDVKLDQTDLSILKEKAEKELPSAPPPPVSFLERYKTSQEEKPPLEKPKLESTFAASDIPPQSAPPVGGESPKKTETQGYSMPNLPKSSILSKLLPIGLFLMVIALAIFLGMKFLPGLSGAKKVELTWWGLWEDEKVVASTIAAYKKIKPNVTITYIKKNPKEYRTLLQTSIARGTGPDIFRFHNTWLPMLSVELQAMPEKMKNDMKFSTVFYPTAYYDLVKNNEIFGIPLMFDGLALYYNSDMLASAGQKVPTGWSETADLARKLTVFDEGGNIKVSGLALGNTTVDHWSDILGLMMLQNGADPALPTDSCAKEALEYYVSFAASDKTRVWDDTLGSSTLAFANGKAAMYIGPSWEAFEIKKINPTLNFGIAPFPQVAGGKRYWATYWVEGVNSKSENSAAAWDFLAFLSQKESLERMYADASKSSKERLFGEIYPRTDMASLLATDPLVGPYVSGAPQAKSWYLASRTYDDGINDRMIKYYEDTVNSVVKKQKTSDEALKTASAGVAQVLKDYGLTPPTSNKNCQAVTP